MDAFSRFNLPRALVIDPAQLDQVVRAASRDAHPDSGGDPATFEDIRKAGDTLKSPMLRLKLALELSGGDLDSRGGIAGEVMDFFAPIAGVLQEVDEFVLQRSRARSGLGKAMLDAKIPSLKGRVEDLVARLGELEEKLVGRFEEFDRAGWDGSLDAMSETARALAFVTKWQAQLRAATGKLFEALLGG